MSNKISMSLGPHAGDSARCGSCRKEAAEGTSDLVIAGVCAALCQRCLAKLHQLTAPALECKACTRRRTAGFEGQCPACANERTRDELRAERAAATAPAMTACAEANRAWQNAAWQDATGCDTPADAQAKRNRWAGVSRANLETIGDLTTRTAEATQELNVERDGHALTLGLLRQANERRAQAEARVAALTTPRLATDAEILQLYSDKLVKAADADARKAHREAVIHVYSFGLAHGRAKATAASEALDMRALEWSGQVKVVDAQPCGCPPTGHWDGCMRPAITLGDTLREQAARSTSAVIDPAPPAPPAPPSPPPPPPAPPAIVAWEVRVIDYCGRQWARSTARRSSR